MKKMTAVTTALAMSLCLAPSYVFAAEPAAAGGECVYPDEFVNTLPLTDVADYAVYGEQRAFADGTKNGNTIYILAPDEYGDLRKNTITCQYRVSDIEYGDDGTLYIYSAPYTYACRLPQTTPEIVSFDFETAYPDEHTIVIDGPERYEYRINTITHELYSIDESNTQTTLFEDGCSQLKQYDGTAYVINDGKVYTLNGTKTNPVPLQYIDHDLADNIATANAAEILAEPYEPELIAIYSRPEDGKNTYITRIDLDVIGPTFTNLGTQKLETDCEALAIAEVGNATIFVMPDDDGFCHSYITLTSAVEKLSYTPPENDMEGAYAREALTIYSRPYMCGATALAQVDRGAVFRVEEKFTLAYMSETYYKVSTEDGMTGYVAGSLLSPYTFAAEDENAQSSGTDSFVYDNGLKTVIIVLLIVLLVLIAAGYVTFYLTRRPEKAAGKRKKSPPPDDDAYTQ